MIGHEFQTKLIPLPHNAIILNQRWKTLESKIVYSSPWLDVHEDKVLSPEGNETEYIWYSSQDVSIVVPFIDNDTLVMIDQYRYPVGKRLLEFPAGHIEKNESPQEAALRELEEETGYKADKIKLQYSYLPSASKSKQNVFVYRAEGLKKGKSTPDRFEEISLQFVSVKQLETMIFSRTIDNAATLIAFLICCINPK